MGVEIETEAVMIIRFRLLSFGARNDRSDCRGSSGGEMDRLSSRSRRAERLRVGIFVAIVAAILRQPQFRVNGAEVGGDRKRELPFAAALAVMRSGDVGRRGVIGVARDAKIVVGSAPGEAD